MLPVNFSYLFRADIKKSKRQIVFLTRHQFIMTPAHISQINSFFIPFRKLANLPKTQRRHRSRPRIHPRTQTHPIAHLQHGLFLPPINIPPHAHLSDDVLRTVIGQFVDIFPKSVAELCLDVLPLFVGKFEVVHYSELFE